MIKKQTTIKESVVFEGIGLHTGKKVTMTVKPAHKNYGINFLRTDIDGAKPIKAIASNIYRTDMSVTLGSIESSVATVEHFLSAAQALELNNLLIELDAPELPILDGSSHKYIEKLADKIEILDEKVKYYKITKPVTVRKGDSFLYLLPADDFAVSCKIDFSHPSIGEQVFHIPHLNLTTYSQNISFAKTFGFLYQLEDLHARGLAMGANKENAIVLEEKNIHNPEVMTYEDEFVRHKMLDILGDMYLLNGKPLIAHVVAYKSGHELHVKAINELLNTQSYILTEKPEKVALNRRVWTLKDVISKVLS